MASILELQKSADYFQFYDPVTTSSDYAGTTYPVPGHLITSKTKSEIISTNNHYEIITNIKAPADVTLFTIIGSSPNITDYFEIVTDGTLTKKHKTQGTIRTTETIASTAFPAGGEYTFWIRFGFSENIFITAFKHSTNTFLHYELSTSGGFTLIAKPVYETMFKFGGLNSFSVDKKIDALWTNRKLTFADFTLILKEMNQ